MGVSRDFQVAINKLRKAGETNGEVLERIYIEWYEKYSETIAVLEERISDLKNDKETYRYDIIILLNELRKYTRVLPAGLKTTIARH